MSLLKYRLTVDMTFEEESHLEATIGTHHVREGQGEVEVAATGTQVGEVVTMTAEGTLPDLLEWLLKEWEDDDLAVEAFAAAAAEGRLEMI